MISKFAFLLDSNYAKQMRVYFFIFFALLCRFAFCDSFTEIKTEVYRLPQLFYSAIAENIELYSYEPEKIFDAVKGAHLPGLGFDALYQAEKQFFETTKESGLTGTPEGFFDIDKAMPRKHYVQKLVVPVGTKILLHGDLHGDVHSLVTSLEPYMKENDGFKLRDDIYVVFLGDYVDKGIYGLECIYILLRLKIDNPDRVFLVRGNHEDSAICSIYGFQDELIKKGFTKDQIEVIYRLYDIMPVALYLGSNHNFVQLCHGGFELGYLPTALLNESIDYEWLTELNRFSVYSQLSPSGKKQLDPIIQAYPNSCKDHMIPEPNSTMQAWIGDQKFLIQLGFLWADFIVSETEPMSYKPHRGYVYNKKITRELLRLINSGPNKLCGIFRGHQHKPEPNDPLMRLLLNLDARDDENKGVAKLWSKKEKTGNSVWRNMVVTFNLSPNTLFGPQDGTWPGFDFDTLGELTTSEHFSKWTLRIHRTSLSP